MAAAPSSSAIIDLGDDELQFTESTPPGGGGGGGGTTHTFGAPHSAVDDDGGDDDREQLLGEGRKGAGGGGGGNFLSVDFYRRFFDVDTDEVGARILGAVVPVRGRSFLQDVTKRRPDLYGPFWICTTLVVSVAVTGNMASYLQSAWVNGGRDFEWHYDFHKVTLSATAVFSYAWLVPAAIYGFLWWTASGALAALGFLDLICLYGYSLAIYVPISVLWLIQYSWVQWILVLVGAGLSGAVIVATLYPILRDGPTRGATMLILVIVGLHLLLACGFMLYFFHVPPSAAKESPATEDGSKSAVPGGADEEEKVSGQDKKTEEKRTAGEEEEKKEGDGDPGGDGADEEEKKSEKDEEGKQDPEAAALKKEEPAEEDDGSPPDEGAGGQGEGRQDPEESPDANVEEKEAGEVPPPSP